MNVADDPLVAVLNEVVRSDSAASIIGTTLQRVLRQLDASAKLMAWETVPLRAFADGLPESIRSCWILVIRAGAATGAERHPNSHQRSYSLIAAARSSCASEPIGTRTPSRVPTGRVSNSGG
jgi:hypothetical protein